jgi:hypothetical protein
MVTNVKLEEDFQQLSKALICTRKVEKMEYPEVDLVGR